jgi:Tfp pilus assembly protein PilP
MTDEQIERLEELWKTAYCALQDFTDYLSEVRAELRKEIEGLNEVKKDASTYPLPTE